MYRVRFHLAKGKNFMKWQVKNLRTNEVTYYDPETVKLDLYDCVLRNQSKTAKKIHDGANKTVCAWIDAKHVSITAETPLLSRKYSFNPRVRPNWFDESGDNCDGKKLSDLITIGRKVFAPKNTYQNNFSF